MISLIKCKQMPGNREVLLLFFERSAAVIRILCPLLLFKTELGVDKNKLR